jgi:hypothetical protein
MYIPKNLIFVFVSDTSFIVSSSLGSKDSKVNTKDFKANQSLIWTKSKVQSAAFRIYPPEIFGKKNTEERKITKRTLNLEFQEHSLPSTELPWARWFIFLLEQLANICPARCEVWLLHFFKFEVQIRCNPALTASEKKGTQSQL